MAAMFADVARPCARGAGGRRRRKSRSASPAARSASASARAPIFAARTSSSDPTAAASVSAASHSRCRCPGAHNVANALAAIAACRALGVPLDEMVGAAREPSRASAAASRPSARRAASRWWTTSPTTPTRSPPRSGPRSSAAPRVLAIYQPHGYGPTRFLRRDFVTTFARELGPDDRLFMLEVFYAGGTATRDFSAADIVAEIAALGSSRRVRALARLARGAHRRRGAGRAISCW